MKFDDYFNSLITEMMPLDVYGASDEPEVKRTKKAKVVKALTSAIAPYMRENRGSIPNDFFRILVQNAEDKTAEELADEISVMVVDTVFPQGTNPARTAKEFAEITKTKLTKAFTSYINDASVNGINDTHAKYTLAKILKFLNKGSLQQRDWFNTQGREGREGADVRAKGNDLEDYKFDWSATHDPEQEARDFGIRESRINEMAVSLTKETFVNKVVADLLSRHKDVDSQNAIGTDLYHVSVLASKVHGKPQSEINEGDMKNVIAKFAGAVYDVAHDSTGVNPATGSHQYRESLQSIMQDALTKILSEYNTSNGQALSAKGLSKTNDKYTARIIANAILAVPGAEVALTGSDNTRKTWSTKKLSESNIEEDDSDDELEDNDDDTEQDDEGGDEQYAYEHGILSDDETEDDSDDENQEDEQAESEVANIERAGIDIANRFLRSFEVAVSEINDEDDSFEDEDDVFNPYEDEEEMRRDILGRGLARNEDDQDEVYSPWHQSRIERDYDEDEENEDDDTF